MNIYSSLDFKPPIGQYTILAAFALSSASSSAHKIISIGTGSKCLPTVRFSPRGDALHDCHAEVLARRGAIRWFLEEIGRYRDSGRSEWIISDENHRYTLKHGVRIHLYISTVPLPLHEGGDASTRFLASFQDEEMAALKGSMIYPLLSSNTAARGRDNYSLFGVLRTKPGRGDSPPTLCMSCSDKICTWNVLGFQGALASKYLGPLYIESIVIGEVSEGMRETVKEDCERAFWRRLDGAQDLPPGFELHRPTIHFTDSVFAHSRASMVGSTNSSCNDALCWIADSPKPHEVLINGLKRGVPPKHRHHPKFRPQLSKVSLFQMYNQISTWHSTTDPDTRTYFETKQSVSKYQTAKQALTNESAPFAGWRKSGRQWENFGLDGECFDTVGL